MAVKLHTYALVKTLFNQNKDYFDTFVPLVLGVVGEVPFIDLITIQTNLKSELCLNIPIHILKTICTRAEKTGYLDREESTNKYRLNKIGLEYLKKQEPVEDVERRTNSFINAISSFFKTKGCELDSAQIQELLKTFIKNNIEGLIDFINPKVAQISIEKSISKQESFLLVEFIKEIQLSKPEEYKQFQELILGSILLALLSVETSSDISDIEARKFGEITVFFDTNFVFSLFGFHSEEMNKAAKELFKLLSESGFKARIFDFTVDEICRVTNGYIQHKNKLPLSFQVDSVYSSLKRLGWESSDVSDFISNIEKKLEELGIEIRFTDVDLANYNSPLDDTLRHKIAANKPDDYRGLSTNHDLAAIDQIRKIRKRTVRKIEDTAAFFLTADFALQRTAMFSLGHSESGTISEVIMDGVMANILWLKNPQITLPLSTVIATHSRGLLVDRRVWDKFYTVLEKLKKEGTVTDDKINMLFYRSNLANSLREYDRTDLDKIDTGLVMETIEEAVETVSKEKQAMSEAHSTIEEKLFKTTTEKDNAIQKHNGKIIQIKNGLRKKAKKDSTKLVNPVVVIIILIACFAEFMLFTKLYPLLPKQYAQIFDWAYGGGGLSLAIGTTLLIWKFRSKIIEKREQSIYKNLLEQVTLEE